MSQAQEEQNKDYLVKSETVEPLGVDDDFSSSEECQEIALENMKTKLEEAGVEDDIDVRIARKGCSNEKCNQIHADMLIGVGHGWVRIILEGRVNNAEDEDHAAAAMTQTLDRVIDGYPFDHLNITPINDDTGD